jgi:hypothetical protein
MPSPSLAVLALLVLGCSEAGGDAPTRSHSPDGATNTEATGANTSAASETTSCRAPDANGKTCFGTPGSRLVTTLDEDAAEIACRNMREATVAAISEEVACHRYAANNAPDIEGTDSEVRAKCNELYEQCMADPAQVRDEYQGYQVELVSAPCRAPTECDVTFDELAECVDALKEKRGSRYRSCEEVNADEAYPEEDPPEVCALLPDDCYWFVNISQ